MREVFQAEFGARLKAARVSRNLAVADVAAKLKLTARQVEALEEEDFSHLPSEVFVRGFVRNYARLVGINPESLIAPVDVQAEVSETITAPNAGLNVGSSGIRLWLVYPAIGMAVFLILVAALYHWLRQGEDTLITAPPAVVSQSNTVAPTDAVIPPAIQTLPETAPPDSEAPLITPLPMPNVGQATDSAAASVPEPTAPAVMPVSGSETAAAMSTPNGNDKSALRSMRFEPAQDAWIQVVDGKGARFSKLVRAGSSDSFSGMPPFRLVVGEAALVKLTYNGHSIDLSPYIGQKVARLTLD